MGYSKGQIVKFAVMAVGFTMCLTGCAAPYWLVAEEKGDSSQPTGGQIVGKASAGLWQVCISLGKEYSECVKYDFKSGAIGWKICMVSIFNLVSTFGCLVSGVSRILCRKENKTIYHSVKGVIAGIAGLAAIGLFAANTEPIFKMTFGAVKYGWAFWIYIVGNILVILASLSLCCSPSETTKGGWDSHLSEDRLPLEETAEPMHVDTTYPGVHRC